ncbi:MAG TPA: hypothetical protein VK828_11770 [Terriglobales bacterium]|jgi:hypothetical protein|nr:hypothetical protein [Terriglobales bacterium]
MHRSLFIFFGITLLTSTLMAQTTPAASSGTMPQAPQDSTAQPAGSAAPSATSSSASAAPRIAAGSVLPVELTKGINAKKAKKGDEVVAKVTQDLRTPQGTVILPKDTQVVGHITEAQPHSKEQKESELSIAFDHAVLKNGETMQMPMSIQAIIAPPNRNPANSASGYPSSSPAPGAGPTPTAAGGRPGMGGTAPSTVTAPQSESSSSSETPAPTQTRPQITGETQGVVGIADLKLSAAPDATQGSLVTSEKNNVKLDDGTFLLLRVQP